MTYGSLGKCPPCQRDIRPLLCILSPGMLFGTGHSAPAHDMASDLHLSHTRPTSRPSATGADRELAPPVAGLAALGAAGVALSAAAAWIAATGAGSEPRGFSAAVHALVIAAPMAAGLYAVYRNPGGRFGWLLLLAGVLWSPTMLAESSHSVLYSIGRVSVWFAELLLIYLVLAFPTGRLVSRGTGCSSAPAPCSWRCTWYPHSSATTPSRARGPPAAPIAQPTPSCCRAPSPASSEPYSCRCSRRQACSSSPPLRCSCFDAW